MPWTLAKRAHHELFDWLRLIGLRDRLRCPSCKAVGTWKPHGGTLDQLVDWWTDFKSTLNPKAIYTTDRRWVCKYCGYTRDKEGEHFGAPNKIRGVWDYKCEDSAPTPKEAVECMCCVKMAPNADKAVWPWRG